MEYVRLRGEEHHFSMPVKMILYSLEAAQDLMVAVRDLRRTVRLVQSGCVTFFPEEAHGLQLIYNTLEADLQQVELDGQRITQHLLTALAASYEDIVRVAGFSRPSTRGVWVNHLYLVPAADGGMTDQGGTCPSANRCPTISANHSDNTHHCDPGRFFGPQDHAANS